MARRCHGILRLPRGTSKGSDHKHVRCHGPVQHIPSFLHTVELLDTLGANGRTIIGARRDEVRAGRFCAGVQTLAAAQSPVRARVAGVPDLQRFAACVTDSTTAPAVDRDTKAALALRNRGTPTVLVNGVKFTGVPASGTLDSLVRAAILTQGGRTGTFRR